MTDLSTTPRSPAMPVAHLLEVSTSTPSRSYTQEQILDWMQEADPKVHRLFHNSHIERRFLDLPEPVGGEIPEESAQDLINKHLRGALRMGQQAIESVLERRNVPIAEVDFLVCVSSTGFLCPSISAHLTRSLRMPNNMRRVDIVGMGCNAAVNGLQSATAMATARPGRYGLLVCLEVCSAAYARNRKMSTAVVNSLFGDGGGALLVQASRPDSAAADPAPAVLDFEPFILTDAIDAMKFELEDGRLSFFLDKNIPHVIGQHVAVPVDRLLARHGLDTTAIRHWLVHSGGKKVIDAIERHLALPADALRHTRAVLRDYGNLSSASVLFALERLAREGVAHKGDFGVVIGMGPGTSIETALIRW